MKLITRDTDYAVRALLFIAAEKRKRVAASDLVARLKIPRPFLRKILQTLNKEGLLHSYKGQAGGFSLAAPPSKISLADLIEIFQGHLDINECTFKRQLCPNRKECRLKRKIDKLQRHVVGQLKTITLASLLKGE